ncbi:hypothetical protein OUZ56_010138 [Daphnia magna]|uniref:Uncharacterized protein n=1 Tax=Daphnia magna TaxID=35525 RepID=A0ABR0AHX3_9CRUS|nr:hypothetical protein OUZ56_010138 [Daphnia magna]
MAENSPPSAASVKEKVQKSREMEKMCITNLRERQQELLKARKVDVDAVYAHQLVVKRLYEELDNVVVDPNNKNVKVRPADRGMQLLYVADQPGSLGASFFVTTLFRMLPCLGRCGKFEALGLPSTASLLHMQLI